MKENVLDVLMYLFENFIYEEVEESPDRDTLQSTLQEAGFSSAEIEKAFTWLEGLASQQTADNEEAFAPRSIRVYSRQEQEKLDSSSQGFLLFLEQNGILTPQHRELVIDRVMALEGDDIDLERLRWVILMVLFNQPGQEAAYAWMEDLVFDHVASYVQ
jgi:Smg protein